MNINTRSILAAFSNRLAMRPKRRPSRSNRNHPQLEALEARKLLAAAGTVALTGDFDGDGKDDTAVWQPKGGRLFIDTGTPGFSGEQTVQFGLETHIPLVGDFDGDGRDQFAVWDPQNGNFYVDAGSPGYNGERPVQLGQTGDVPLVGDFNGNGRDQLAVWRPKNGKFFVDVGQPGYSGEQPVQFGLKGDTPLIGDFDGDGRDQLAVWRPSNSRFYVGVGTPGFSGEKPVRFGKSGDVPLVGDFNGNGREQLAVWRPGNGNFYVGTGSPGNSGEQPVQFGLSKDAPQVGDFDGDGRDQLAVWRAASSELYVDTAQPGFNGERPIHFANKTPEGWLGDVNADFTVSGWGLDRNVGAERIRIHFYIDDDIAGAAWTGISRTDVTRVTGVPGNHGFSWQIPEQFLDGHTHTVRAYAIDPHGAGNVELSGSGKQFNSNRIPEGWVDGINSDFIAYGWALDRDLAPGATSLHFYVDGEFAGTDRTDLSRPDVNRATGVAGKHGYAWQIPSRYLDGKEHVLNVHAIDDVGQHNTLLSGSGKKFRANLLLNAVTTINEGQDAVLTGKALGLRPYNTFTLEIDWNDGSPIQKVVHRADGSGNFNFSHMHRYLDDNPTGTPSDVYDIDVALQETMVPGEDVVFVIDKSLSTIERPGGINVGDVNRDGKSNTVLDVEIKAFMALNQYLIDQGRAGESDVAAVAFEWPSRTYQVDMNPDQRGVQLSTKPGADLDRNGVRDVDQALKSLRAEGKTGFEAGLQQAINTIVSLGNTPGQWNVIFLSDGSPNPADQHYADEVATLKNVLKANVRAFGVGPKAEVGPLRVIDPHAFVFKTFTQLLDVFSGAAGIEADATTSVRVNNVKPRVDKPNLSATAIDENGIVTVTGSFTDPGTQDTHRVMIDWGDGSRSQYVPHSGGRYLAAHRYLDDNPIGTAADRYTISVTVTDDDTGSSSASTTLTVNNVNPVVQPLELSATEIDENGRVTVSGSFTDEGSRDTHRVYVDWGDGSPIEQIDHADREFTATHQYLDDNPTATASDPYTIRVGVLDDDTGLGLTEATITVNNLPPILPPPQLSSSEIDENGTVTLTGSFTDPGTLDTHRVFIDWGDGSDLEPVSHNNGNFSASHQYLDDNPTKTPQDVYSVRVRVIDDDGGVGLATTDIIVRNLEPVVSPLNLSATEINENGSVTLTGSFTDVGIQDTHRVFVDWGDGSEPQVVEHDGGTFSATHQYFGAPSIPGGSNGYSNGGSQSFVIKVTVTDDDGGVGTATATIVVRHDDSEGHNTAPTITSLTSSHPDSESKSDGYVSINGSVFDPDAGDTNTVTVDWGDGTPPEEFPVDDVTDLFSASHDYSRGGVFEIRVNATDNHGAVSETKTTTAVVTGVGVVDGTLFVIGTDGRDIINIRHIKNGRRPGIRVDTRLNVGSGIKRARENIDATTVERIVVIACGGNDRVRITRTGRTAVTIPTVLLGGSGSDLLRGGAGSNVIVGGDGRDRIQGGASNDILIGGEGRDNIRGGGGQDVVIGGYTVFDNNLDALDQIYRDWTTSTDYLDRVDDLRSGSGSSQLALAAGVTVFDDGDRDNLNGGKRRDWYLADTDGQRQDNDRIRLERNLDELVDHIPD